MAWTQGQELLPYHCTAVALTPGWIRSEVMLDNYDVTEANWREATVKQPHFVITESPHYVGRASLPSQQIQKWLIGMVNRFQAVNLQKSMVSLIWTGPNQMLGAIFVKSRILANQPMQLDTGKVASVTATSRVSPYNVHCSAAGTEFA